MDVWKDSELALLFHGLDKRQERFAAFSTISEMEDVASRMKVGLARTMGNGRVLRLVERRAGDP